MANKIYFITTQYLKDNSVINGNVDSDTLKPFIIKAQDLNLEHILGTDLIQKIESEIVAGTLTGVYKTLMDNYIQRTVKEWTIVHALPFVNYKLTNKAISKKDSDNSSPADLDEMVWLTKSVRDTAEYYSERLRKHLLANSSDYPEFTSNSDSDDIRPDGNTYFNGLYLDDDNDDCGFGLGVTFDL